METRYKKVTIGEVGKSSTYYEVVEHRQLLFRIIVKAGNGDAIGFNSDCCLSCWNGSEWRAVVDNRSIGVKFDKDAVYYGRGSEADKKRVLEKPVKEFKDYIEKIYY